jgi:hypothetical protein
MNYLPGFKTNMVDGFAVYFRFKEVDYVITYKSGVVPAIASGTAANEEYFKEEGIVAEKVQVPEDLAMLAKLHYHSGQMLLGTDGQFLAAHIKSAAEQ